MFRGFAKAQIGVEPLQLSFQVGSLRRREFRLRGNAVKGRSFHAHGLRSVGLTYQLAERFGFLSPSRLRQFHLLTAAMPEALQKRRSLDSSSSQVAKRAGQV